MSGSSLTSAAGARRAAAAAGLAAALLVGAWHLPGVVRRLDNAAAVGHGASAAARRLPAAPELGIDPAVFDRAARAIPRDGVFLVATPEGTDDLAVLAFPNMAADELLPRRRTLEPGQAGWVLAYGVEPAAAGLPLGPVRRLGPDVAVAEVRR